jgi:hypothetical protein
MKLACIVSGIVFGAILALVGFLFALRFAGRFLDLFPGASEKDLQLQYAILALSIIAGSLAGGIFGSRAADSKPTAIVLIVTAAGVSAGVIWFLRHASS